MTITSDNYNESISFHGLKHHLQYCREFIKTKQTYPQLIQQLKTLGASQMDFYTGSLSIKMILNEVDKHLTKIRVTTPDVYQNWLTQKGYQNIVLSDHSCWTLTLNRNKTHYIHLHPARHSLHTIRIKATSLKTILACKVLLANRKNISIGQMNHIRKHSLQLSPISAKHNTILYHLNELI